MKNTDLLDQARARAGLPSDYALAARLGVSRAAVSRYRQTDSVPDAWVAFGLADLLGMDPAHVIALCELDRAELRGDDKLAASWRRRLAAFERSTPPGAPALTLMSSERALRRPRAARAAARATARRLTRICSGTGELPAWL